VSEPVGERSRTTVLQAKGVAKDYGDGLGLLPLDLEIGPGELVMLVGPNGAGKSTFLRLVSGLLEPTEGEVLVDGAPAGSMEARAATSFIPDAPVLYDDLSVQEHLEYVARLHGVTAWKERADELLDRLTLTSRADDLPSRFSRGMRQKTSLAVGLVRPFSLLLVDEPFVGLDAPTQTSLVELLAGAAAEGAALLVSTHQLDLVDRATRCVAVREGEVAFDGEPSAETVLRLVA
jgi:ABC-2 type transport system ATP-binding protein